MPTESKDVKQIQVNVWLGANPKVEVFAKAALKGHLCTFDATETIYKRAGLASKPGTTEVVVELCDKISKALQTGHESIKITVDGFRIEPDG